MVRFYILGKIMKKELEIRQQLADKKAKIDMHKKLLQNGFQYREILIKTATFLILSNKHWNNRKLNFV